MALIAEYQGPNPPAYSVEQIDAKLDLWR